MPPSSNSLVRWHLCQYVFVFLKIIIDFQLISLWSMLFAVVFFLFRQAGSSSSRSSSDCTDEFLRSHLPDLVKSNTTTVVIYPLFPINNLLISLDLLSITASNRHYWAYTLYLIWAFVFLLDYVVSINEGDEFFRQKRKFTVPWTWSISMQTLYRREHRPLYNSSCANTTS